MSTRAQPNRISEITRAVLLVSAIICLCTGACLSQSVTSIVLVDVVVDPSEILSQEEIQSVTCRYIGTTVTVEDLNHMVDEINDLYRAKGVVTAKAVLPAQAVEEGVVEIRLVEGRIGRVLVQGNKDAFAGYFIDRIRLMPGDLVRLDDIAAEVAHFNLVNDDQVAVQLRPGEQFGTTDCIVMVDEAADQVFSYVDNSGRDEAGMVRYGTTMVLNHLLGRGDPFTASAVWAAGTFACSLTYRIPVGIRGARLTIGSDNSEVDVLVTGFGDLGVKGHSSNSYAEWSWPVVVGQKLTLWGSARLQWRHSRSTLSGATLASSYVSAAGAGFSARWIDDGLSWQCSSEYIAGTVEPGFTGNDNSAFSRLGASFAWQDAMDDRHFLMIRGKLQIAPEQLPSSDQFSVGGASSVRGYPEGALIGDQGFFVSVELGASIVEQHRGSVFIDCGAASTSSGGSTVPGAPGQIASIGIGLSGAVADIAYSVAYAMSHDSSPRFHVSVQKSF